MSEEGPPAGSADTAVHDVVIVGAGAAGLAAASALASSGLDIVVLEARGRPGGRIHTLHDPAHPLPIELGAEFIDVPGPAWDALRRGGGVAYRSVNGFWDVKAGRARRLDIEAALEPVLSRLAAPPERDQSFFDFLNECCCDLPARDRQIARRYVEGFHAADIDRVGVHWLAETAQNDGGGGGPVRHHTLQGFDAVVRGLMAVAGATCDIRFNTVVREVRWSRQPAELRCSARIGGDDLGPVLARRVLVTVPLGVLQTPDAPGGLRFRPELPERKQRAIQALSMGSVQRITFRFRERFWEKTLRFSKADEPGIDELKLFIGDQAFPTWWTPSPVLAPVLVAWAGGGAARNVASDPRGTLGLAIHALARMLDLRSADVERYIEDAYSHDWDADPFACGAYSYVPAGALSSQEALRQPVDGVLFFAGEATATADWNATVDGAIRSGWRAAAELQACRCDVPHNEKW